MQVFGYQIMPVKDWWKICVLYEVNNMETLQHTEQRVLVLFDVQNMYYSAKNIFNAKVNFHEILKTAVGGRKLVRAIAYVIKTEIREEESFHKALMNIGIEVKSKDLQTFVGGSKKGDWDIGIAMDAVRLSNKVDTVVLVSGDGDFKDLLAYLKSHGNMTEVIAFSKTSSKMIKEESDLFIDLEANKRKYLIAIGKKNVVKGSQKKESYSHKTHESENPNTRIVETKTHHKSEVKKTSD